MQQIIRRIIRAVVVLIQSECDFIKEERIRQDWVNGAVDPAIVKARAEYEQSRGEWHRDKENEKMLYALMRKAYGSVPDLVIAHHLLVIHKDSEPLEIASATDMIFDKMFLKAVTGDVWDLVAKHLSTMENQDRLLYLYENFVLSKGENDENR